MMQRLGQHVADTDFPGLPRLQPAFAPFESCAVNGMTESRQVGQIFRNPTRPTGTGYDPHVSERDPQRTLTGKIPKNFENIDLEAPGLKNSI